MAKYVLFTSKNDYENRLQMAGLKYFVHLCKKKIESFGHGDADEILDKFLVSIHEHNNYYTVTSRKGYHFLPWMSRVWTDYGFGELHQIRFVRNENPITNQEYDSIINRMSKDSKKKAK